MSGYRSSRSSGTGSFEASFEAPSSPPSSPGAFSSDEHSTFGSDHLPRGSSDAARFILVIGGLGFIGSHTTLELLKAGHNVIIVDDLSNSFPTVLTRVKKLAAKYFHEQGRDHDIPQVHFHKLDYRSKSMRFLLESYSELVPIPNSSSGRLVRRSSITGVIHFAAFKSVSESIDRPLDYYNNNVCGLVGLLELLAKHNVRSFVFSSSATVYGAKANEGRPLREEDLVHHPEKYIDAVTGTEVHAEPSIAGLQSPYARSKYFCEAILADVALADPAWRIIALRYFNPIGCDASGLLGEDPRMIPTNLFPVISQVLTGERDKLDVYGTDWETRDGTAVRDFVHVSDVARGHVAAVEVKTDTPFKTFNLGSGSGTSVVEAVQSLEKAAGRQIPVRWSGRRAGDVGSCVALRNRAGTELGWSPQESIEQCATDLWNYVSKTKKLHV